MSRSLRRLAVVLTACVLAGCMGRRVVVPGPRSAPDAVRPALARADALARAGREEEALAVYAAAVDADPSSVPAHLRYVGTFLDLGRRSQALLVYRARAARQGATDADRTMAQRLETDGSSSALRRVYLAASERSPASAWWRLAMVEVEVAEADAWNRRRRDAMDRGDRSEETHAYEQARGALARADAALARAQSSGPELPEVDLYRGFLRAVEGDVLGGAVSTAAAYRAAEAAFERTVARDPDLVDAWEGLGDVRLRTGDLRGSLEAYVEAATRSPADPRLREAVGIVLHRVGRYREAAEQYHEAARLAPRDATVWLRLGDARAEDERWDEALEAYDEALRRDDRAIEAHYRQGTVLEHLDRLGEARAAYDRYLTQGGPRAATVRRRVERLLRAQEGGGR